MSKTGNLHVFPSLVCVIGPVTFIITFSIAAMLGHVRLFLPYISDTGNRLPERCIFSQFFNITAFLLLICIYIRYLQIKAMATFKSPIGHRLNANEISWYMGFLSALGMSMMANFQVGNVYQVHYIGTIMLFIGGSIYFTLQVWMLQSGYGVSTAMDCHWLGEEQGRYREACLKGYTNFFMIWESTIFSYHISKVEDSKYLFYARCFFCIFSALLCTSAIINGISAFNLAGVPATIEWNWLNISYLLSTCSEWLLAINFSALILTFIPEFKKISIFSPQFEIQGIHDEDDTESGRHSSLT